MTNSGIRHVVSSVPVPRTEYEDQEHHALIHGIAFPAGPGERQLFYRDDEHKWYIYNGTAWTETTSQAPATLNDIGDVNVPTPTDGYFLYWDDATSKWKAKAHAALTTGEAHATGEGTRAYNSIDQTIPDTTWTMLTLDSEAYDTDAIHDNVTNNTRLTCKTAGLYFIWLQVKWTANVTGRRIIGVYLNGTSALIYKEDAVPGNNTFNQICGTFAMLSVNDYVEARIFQTSGDPLDVLAEHPMSNEFMMQRVG